MKTNDLVIIGFAALAAYLIVARVPAARAASVKTSNAAAGFSASDWRGLGIDPTVNYSSAALGGQPW